MLDNLLDWLPDLLDGVWVTVLLTLAPMPIALVLGLVFALCRLDGAGRVFAWPAAAIVEALRGTPLLLQLFYIYFVLPYLGVRFDPIPAAIIGLSLNYAAYPSDGFRSGIAA